MLAQSYDGVALSASIEHGTVNVTASGVPDFVAEVGEQLAWLGAALHPSSSGREVQCCTPYISHIQPIPGRDVEIKCDIAFKLDNSEKLAEDTNGQCWHGLFNGPVIVPGFPIPLRPDTKTSKGLEIPLGMLVALARTRYVDTFESKIFIKGFSCLLAPTQMTDNILVWHLIFNKNPEDHISYLDWNLSHCDVGMADIERSRHIVGWCIDAACIAGKFGYCNPIGMSSWTNMCSTKQVHFKPITRPWALVSLSNTRISNWTRQASQQGRLSTRRQAS